MEISLIDGRPRELVTLTLDGLSLEYKTGVTGGVDFTQVHATLKSAQLDDQLPGSPHPVVLLPLAEVEALINPSHFSRSKRGRGGVGGGGGDREPLLYFSFVSEPGRKKGALYCPCIVAKLAPVKISVAESLVWRMAAFSSALSAAAMAASQSDPAASSVAAAKSSSSSTIRSAMGGSGSNASSVSRSALIAEGGGAGLPLQVDFLNIEDMVLSLRWVSKVWGGGVGLKSVGWGASAYRLFLIYSSEPDSLSSLSLSLSPPPAPHAASRPTLLLAPRAPLIS